MANEFYIEPAGNLMKGLSVLGDALENRTAVMKDKAMRQGAMDVIKKGTADEIADYIAKNPGADKVVDSVVGFRNEQTKRNMADTAIEVLSAPPEQAYDILMKRVEFVKSHGGDPSGTIALAQIVGNGDYDTAEQLLERGLAMSDPKLYQSYYLSVYGNGRGSASGKEQALSNLGKLVKERDSLPEGSPERAAYDEKIRLMTSKKDTGLSTLGKLLAEQKRFKPGSAEWKSYQKRIDDVNSNKGKTYNDTKNYPVVDNRTGESTFATGLEIRNNPERYTPLAGSVDLQRKKSEAKASGSQRALQINTANDLYQENAPELIELRKKVAAKSLLPKTGIKTVNELDQWMKYNMSDPDVAELKGKATLLAENLQKTVGGGVGEWTFRITKELLDPALSPEAFERRLMSHAKDISNMAKSTRNFGKDSVKQPFYEKPKQALDPKKEKTEWIRAARKANPDATPEQLDAAYRIKKGGR